MSVAASGGASSLAPLRPSARRVGPGVWLPLAFLAAGLGYPLFLLVANAFNVGDPQALPPVEYGVANFGSLLDHLDWVGNTLVVSVSATRLATAIGQIRDGEYAGALATLTELVQDEPSFAEAHHQRGERLRGHP